MGSQRQTYYLGVQHQFSPTPLSILQENPRSETIQSLLRQSARGSNVSVPRVAVNNDSSKSNLANTTIYHGYQNINSRTLGPYLKTFTQRIKLPNLNRSVYSSQNATITNTRSNATSPMMEPTLPQSVKDKGQQTKLTKPREVPEIYEHRIANNF